MAKKIGKTIGDAKKRLQETEVAYHRARVAYMKWLAKEGKVIDLSFTPGATIKQLRKALKGKK